MLTSTEPQRLLHKWKKKYDKVMHWFPLLPFQQFQVLFNSLFKVLCIFPSRYLYAIGLPPIFSFRWNLPPNLSCNPKQLDSLKSHTMAANSRHERECHPLSCPLPRDLVQNQWPMLILQTTIQCANLGLVVHGFTWWALPASVALTRGILVSFFSSA